MSVKLLCLLFCLAGQNSFADAGADELARLRQRASVSEESADAVLRKAYDGANAPAAEPSTVAGGLSSFSGEEIFSNIPEPSAKTATPPPESPKTRGTLVLIQVDGLSYDRLQEALASGYAPHLARLLRAGGFRASPYRCGIPTVTISVQTQIFYGRAIPGNEWHSKSAGEEITGVAAERARGGRGLLAGGRTFSSELLGGGVKDESVAVSAIMEDETQKDGKLRMLARGLKKGVPLYARRLFRHPVDSGGKLFNLAHDSLRMRSDFRRLGFDTKLDRQAPYFISFLGNVVGDVAVEGVKKAVRDRVPVVYADMSGYDEKAHYYGPSSREAFEALQAADREIGDVAQTAGAHGATLFVFSDHGQIPSETFIRKFGLEPQDMLDALAQEANPQARKGDIVFSHVYSMGNIYVKDMPGHVQLDAIERRYPQLAEKLARHPGIGLVLARKGNDFAVFSKGDPALISGGQLISRGDNPLSTYLDERMPQDILLAQITNYMNLEESGDLVIFAPYENGRTIDYNRKYTIVSEHGGIGGEQMHPFILYDPRLVQANPERFLDARDLNALFSSMRP